LVPINKEWLKMAGNNFLIVAAIDFGTAYSGYAFSTRWDFTRDPLQVKMAIMLWLLLIINSSTYIKLMIS